MLGTRGMGGLLNDVNIFGSLRCSRFVENRGSGGSGTCVILGPFIAPDPTRLVLKDVVSAASSFMLSISPSSSSSMSASSPGAACICLDGEPSSSDMSTKSAMRVFSGVVRLMLPAFILVLDDSSSVSGKAIAPASMSVCLCVGGLPRFFFPFFFSGTPY